MINRHKIINTIQTPWTIQTFITLKQGQFCQNHTHFLLLYYMRVSSLSPTPYSLATTTTPPSLFINGYHHHRITHHRQRHHRHHFSRSDLNPSLTTLPPHSDHDLHRFSHHPSSFSLTSATLLCLCGFSSVFFGFVFVEKIDQRGVRQR